MINFRYKGSGNYFPKIGKKSELNKINFLAVCKEKLSHQNVDFFQCRKNKKPPQQFILRRLLKVFTLFARDIIALLPLCLRLLCNILRSYWVLPIQASVRMQGSEGTFRLPVRNGLHVLHGELQVC
jgi:hypothetical protein